MDAACCVGPTLKSMTHYLGKDGYGNEYVPVAIAGTLTGIVESAFGTI
jgi:hypothetical protein